MTVSSNNRVNTYTGDGTTTVFPYTFRILKDTDILVQIKDANGVLTTKTITTDYTVSGAGDSSGGNITFVTAPASTDTIALTRNMPFQQNTDYVENDPLPAQSLEEALDELTMNDLQLLEGQDRTVKFDSTVTTFNTTMPTPEAGKFVKIDTSGNSFTFVTGSPVSGVSGTANEIDVTDVGGTETVSISDTVDLGDHKSLEIPNGTTPSVSVAGQVAIDTDGPTSSINQGMITYHDGTNQLYVAGVDTTPSTDGYYLRYVGGGTNKFTFGAGGKVLQHQVSTGTVDTTTTSTTSVSAGISVSITPIKSTSRIIVVASFNIVSYFNVTPQTDKRTSDYKIRRTTGTATDLGSGRTGRFLDVASTAYAGSFEKATIVVQEIAGDTNIHTYELYFNTNDASTAATIQGASFGPTVLIAYELEV